MTIFVPKKNTSAYNMYVYAYYKEKWFDEKAMNSFMQTIPTKEIFYNELVSLYYKIKDTHSNQ